MNFQTLDWNKFRTFYYVAKAESFTKAAQKLRISQPALSRRIASLEASMGMRLLKRSVKGVVPTEEGKALLETADAMFNVFLRYGEKVNNTNEEAQGFLKILIPPHIPAMRILRLTPDFVEACPQIRMAFMSGSSESSFSTHQADGAIKEFDETATLIEQIYLTTVQVSLYANAWYVQEYGMPHRPDDLDHHRHIALGDPDCLMSCALNSGLEIGRPPRKMREAVLYVTSIEEMKLAALQGAGIAALPEDYAADEPGLIRVFREMKPLSVDLYYVYPSHHKGMKRVTAYGEFLAQKLKAADEAKMSKSA